jgi:hypothetical protein
MFYIGAPTTQADEDADLQRALAESAAESGLPPQESGIIGADVNEKKFGPATRAEYEQDQWAMVPTKIAATTHQRVDLAPSARKRQPAAPAFLRTTKEHRLAAIITILSSIPVARNALLLCGSSARSYGHNSDWWEGRPIPQQQSLGATTQKEWDTDSPTHAEFHEELHRLVAFLDSTDRAYGSVDGLADSSAIDPDHGFGWATVDVEESFFAALKREYEDTSNPALRPLMNMAITERIMGTTAESPTMGPEDNSAPQSGDSDSTEETLFNLLTIPLQEDQSQWVTSLYNALDSVFWNDAFSKDAFPREASRTTFLSDTAAVLAIRVGGDGLCKPCDVPLFLYLDRYMESRKDIANYLQTRIHTVQNFMSKLEKREKSVLTCAGGTGCQVRDLYHGRPHNARECLVKTVDVSRALINRQKVTAQIRYGHDRLSQGIIPSISDIALIHSGEAPYELTQEEQEQKRELENGIELAQEKLADIEFDLERTWIQQLC